MTTPTPSPVLSAELEKEFNEKFYVRHDEHCISQLDDNDCDCGEIDEKRRLKQFVAHAVSRAEEKSRQEGAEAEQKRINDLEKNLSDFWFVDFFTLRSKIVLMGSRKELVDIVTSLEITAQLSNKRPNPMLPPEATSKEST